MPDCRFGRTNRLGRSTDKSGRLIFVIVDDWGTVGFVATPRCRQDVIDGRGNRLFFRFAISRCRQDVIDGRVGRIFFCFITSRCRQDVIDGGICNRFLWRFGCRF